MFRELFSFVLSSFNVCINVFKSFVIDSSSGITFFHFLIFAIFVRILIYVIEFIKHIQVIVNESDSDKK